MARFEPNRYYRTKDPELRDIATPGTLAFWRHEGRGPAYTKFGHRVLYAGHDLNAWLARHRIEPAANESAT